jgi:hypothetical protein
LRACDEQRRLRRRGVSVANGSFRACSSVRLRAFAGGVLCDRPRFARGGRCGVRGGGEGGARFIHRRRRTAGRQTAGGRGRLFDAALRGSAAHRAWNLRDGLDARDGPIRGRARVLGVCALAARLWALLLLAFRVCGPGPVFGERAFKSRRSRWSSRWSRTRVRRRRGARWWWQGRDHAHAATPVGLMLVWLCR